MKKKIMEKWVKALRSGEYKQCQETLCSVDYNTGEKSYCCLGVLTDLYLKERKRQKKGRGIKGFREFTKQDVAQYECSFNAWEVKKAGKLPEDGSLPDEVAKWAGWTDLTSSWMGRTYKTGTFQTPSGKVISLAELNDGADLFEDIPQKGKSFKQIADVIEKNYEHI
jgi:hypothetical protein